MIYDQQNLSKFDIQSDQLLSINTTHTVTNASLLPDQIDQGNTGAIIMPMFWGEVFFEE